MVFTTCAQQEACDCWQIRLTKKMIMTMDVNIKLWFEKDEYFVEFLVSENTNYSFKK